LPPGNEMGEETKSRLMRAYEAVSVPFYLVAGPYYAYQWYILLTPPASAILVAMFLQGSLLFEAFLIAAGVLFGFGLLLVVRRIQYRRAVTDSLNPSVEVIEYTTTYSVKNDDVYDHKLELKIRPLNSGVIQYRARHVWSGGGRMEIVAHYGGDVNWVHMEEDCDDAYVFKFDPALVKGVDHCLMVHARYYDLAKAARPFLGSIINHPILRQRTLRVEFAKERRPDRCFRRIYRSSVAPSPIEESLTKIGDHDGTVEWRIVRPRYRYRYVLAWKYEGSTLPPQIQVQGVGAARTSRTFTKRSMKGAIRRT
jgi:hypothetical protein